MLNVTFTKATNNSSSVVLRNRWDGSIHTYTKKAEPGVVPKQISMNEKFSETKIRMIHTRTIDLLCVLVTWGSRLTCPFIAPHKYPFRCAYGCALSPRYSINIVLHSLNDAENASAPPPYLRGKYVQTVLSWDIFRRASEFPTELTSKQCGRWLINHHALTQAFKTHTSTQWYCQH